MLMPFSFPCEVKIVASKLFLKAYAMLRRNYPKMPQGLEKVIANHACQKYSGRVGQTQAAKEFDDGAVFFGRKRPYSACKNQLR